MRQHNIWCVCVRPVSIGMLELPEDDLNDDRNMLEAFLSVLIWTFYTNILLYIEVH